MDEYRLPKEKREREALVDLVGQDGQYLLTCIDKEADRLWLSQIPAVQILKQVWEQQYKSKMGRSGTGNSKRYPRLGSGSAPLLTEKPGTGRNAADTGLGTRFT